MPEECLTSEDGRLVKQGVELVSGSLLLWGAISALSAGLDLYSGRGRELVDSAKEGDGKRLAANTLAFGSNFLPLIFGSKPLRALRGAQTASKAAKLSNKAKGMYHTGKRADIAKAWRSSRKARDAANKATKDVGEGWMKWAQRHPRLEKNLQWAERGELALLGGAGLATAASPDKGMQALDAVSRFDPSMWPTLWADKLNKSDNSRRLNTFLKAAYARPDKYNLSKPPEDVARIVQSDPERARKMWRDISTKSRTLQAPAVKSASNLASSSGSLPGPRKSLHNIYSRGSR